MDFNIDLEADYNVDVDIDTDIDTDVDFDSDFDVNHDIDINVDIDGNEATFAVDVQAFGDDSATDLNLVVVTTDDWSSILAVGYSAVA